MILIKKGNEPRSLTVYRKTQYAYFDGCPKDEIRKSLLKEQGYLCAYCMRRIDLKHTRIEHWTPEAELSELEKLDYSNMLAVCYKESEGISYSNQTCDSRKGQERITVDPRNSRHIDLIDYQKGTGNICSKDKKINEDLNDRLNLNCMSQNLPENRRAVLRRVIMELNQRCKDGNWKASDISRMLQIYEQPDENGQKKEYAGIVLWYLRRRHNSAK